MRFLILFTKEKQKKSGESNDPPLFNFLLFNWLKIKSNVIFFHIKRIYAIKNFCI